MSGNGIVPIVVIGALILFMLYRRGRALLTRQKIRAGSMMVRMGIFAVLGVAVLASSFSSQLALAADIVGFLIGAGVAMLSMRLTLFEQLPDGLYYTQNIYIGAGVFALFILRFVYRLIADYSVVTTASSAAAYRANPLSQIGGDPLTTGSYFLLIGYYVCYYGLLLWRYRQTQQA